MELAPAPSMAWDSTWFPAHPKRHRERQVIALAQAVQASTIARAPALEMTFCSRTSACADACVAHVIGRSQ